MRPCAPPSTRRGTNSPAGPPRRQPPLSPPAPPGAGSCSALKGRRATRPSRCPSRRAFELASASPAARLTPYTRLRPDTPPRPGVRQLPTSATRRSSQPSPDQQSHLASAGIAPVPRAAGPRTVPTSSSRHSPGRRVVLSLHVRTPSRNPHKPHNTHTRAPRYSNRDPCPFTYPYGRRRRSQRYGGNHSQGSRV